METLWYLVTQIFPSKKGLVNQTMELKRWTSRAMLECVRAFPRQFYDVTQDQSD